MKIEIKILNKEFYHVQKLGGVYYDLPRYATDGSAGLDLKATKDYIIYPGAVVSISTGLAINMGTSSNGDMMGIIVPRSGLGTRGLILANTIGIIDHDYQGEILIKAWNRLDSSEITIESGDRIAQLIFVPIIKAQFQAVEEFTHKTERGGGFGSTGD
jgi:dUTP pyrophosphatase